MKATLIFIALMSGWALFALWLWRKPKGISEASAEAPRRVMAIDYAVPMEQMPQTRDAEVAYVPRTPLAGNEETLAEPSSETPLSDEESKEPSEGILESSAAAPRHAMSDKEMPAEPSEEPSLSDEESKEPLEFNEAGYMPSQEEAKRIIEQ